MTQSVAATSPLIPPGAATILVCLLLSAGLGTPAVGQQDPAAAPGASPVEAAYQFALAKLLVEESAFGEAQAAFERGLELDGTDPYNFVEVAKFHFELAFLSRSAESRRRQLVEAVRYAEEAVRLAPEDPDVLSEYAQIHFRLGEHQLSSLDVARETLEKLRAAGEADIQLLITLGQIYFMKRQPENAADVLTEASSYLPNHRMVQSMLAEALLAAGRLGELEGALAKLIELDPGNIEDRLRLSELRRENGDHRGAAEVLRSAPPELRADPRLKRALAHALFLAGDNANALAITDELIAGEPEASELKRLRVSLLTSMARYGEAAEELRPLLGSIEDPSRRLREEAVLSRLLERVGRADEAVDVLEASLASGSEESSLQLKLALAGALERHGRAEEALARLEAELAAAGIEELPVYGAALSEILERAGRTDEALEILDSVTAKIREAGKEDAVTGIALRKLGVLAASERWQEIADWAPSLLDHANVDLKATALRLLAHGLAELGRVDEGLALLEPKAPSAGGTAVDSPSPGDSPASDETPPARGESAVNERLLLATQVEILFEHGREAEAEALLENVVSGAGTNDLFFAARLYQQAERYVEVSRLMERQIEREPESLQALFMLASAQERLGRIDAAVTTFRKLLELDPDHAPTLNYVGYLWAERGENLEEAREFILRAVALDPDNGAYVDSLGWVSHQLGRLREAREHLEWAARLLPTDPTIFEHLGDLYLKLEMVPEARDSYRQALDLEGENREEVRRKLESLETGP